MLLLSARFLVFHKRGRAAPGENRFLAVVLLVESRPGFVGIGKSGTLDGMAFHNDLETAVIQSGHFFVGGIAGDLDALKQGGQDGAIGLSARNGLHAGSNGIYFIADPDGYWIEIIPAKR